MSKKTSKKPSIITSEKTTTIASKEVVKKESKDESKSQGVLIRRYFPKDYDAIKGLIQSLAQLYGEDFNEYFFKNNMQVRLLDPAIGTFVAEKNNVVCGCAFADTERDPRGELSGRISNVNINEKFVGQGIGSKLVDESIQYLSALSISSIWANVNPKNEPMIKIFKQRGFDKMLKVMEKSLDQFSASDSVALEKEGVKYRTVMEKDSTAVKNLIKDLAKIFGFDFDPFWFDLSFQRYLQVPSSQIFIGEKNKEILGLIFAEVRRDPIGNAYGYISNIMISKNAQGKGVGSQLLTIATSFLQNLNMRSIWANVDHNNERVQKLFEKQNYKHKFTVMVQKSSLGGAC
jgi:ribosomal-protein-alanine N-acetyltransferase